MNRTERVLVIGASSGIGRAVAECLLRGGAHVPPCRVALVARRGEALTELSSQYPGRAPVFVHDVRDYASVPGLFQEIAHELGGLDLVVYASGVMPNVEENEYTFGKDRETIEVNVLGAMAWLDEAARRFTQVRSGVIVGISSIAGERGRRGNPAYASSKAALTTYLESLRNRLGRYGVRVLTIKPGFVDTAMVAGKPGLVMMVSAERAAELIVRAIRRGKQTAYIPARWRLVAGLLKLVPSWLFKHVPV